MEVIDQQRQRIQSAEHDAHVRETGTLVDLWEAAALAAKPDGKVDAAARLRKVADNAAASPAARELARGQQVELLYKAKCWKEFLEAAEAFGREYPSFASGPDSVMPQYIRYARQQLAEQKP